jgi:CheY-like chemotaxis protein
MQSRRILMVDDDEDTREVFGMAFREWGYEARSAESGPEAIAIATEWRPAVTLIDIGMPGMDGYELARRLRQLEIESMKLVAFTGYGRERSRNRATDVGFDAYVVKGTPERLREKLDALTGAAKRIDEAAGARERAVPPHRARPGTLGGTDPRRDRGPS